jgi:hypothetical protein
MKSCLLAFVAAWSLWGCQSMETTGGKPPKNHAIAFGRIKVANKAFDETRFVTVAFNGVSSSRYTLTPDKDGYFFIHLPMGNNFLSKVELLSIQFRPRKEYATVQIDSTPIHYLGDIKLVWEHDRDKDYLAGKTRRDAASANQGTFYAVVSDRYAADLKAFQKLYPNLTTGIKKSLMTLRP